MDIQGIEWETRHITRWESRQRRLTNFPHIEEYRGSAALAASDCMITNTDGNYYQFVRHTRHAQSSYTQIQLRKLVWATSDDDVFTMWNNRVYRFNRETGVRTPVLDVSERIVATHVWGELLNTQVSTMGVKERMLVVGGSRGELIAKNLYRNEVCFCGRTAPLESAEITTALDIYTGTSGARRFIASSNDGYAREYNMGTFQLLRNFQFPWAVNHSSISPDGNRLLVVGDAPEFALVDLNRNTTQTIYGHRDHGSVAAWHPEGHYFATGNQDKTTRVWDTRYLSQYVCLRANIDAARSINYSSDGRYMAVAESADFVHIYNVTSLYQVEQEIDVIGEISGMCFSPSDRYLFFSITDQVDGGLLEFRARQ